MDSAAWMPPIPPPTTSVAGVTGTSRSVSGSCQATRCTLPEIRVLALAVAARRSLVIQEQCSRMFAMARR